MQAEKMKPIEQLTLEPYERDHAVVVGVYRPTVAKKWISCPYNKFVRNVINDAIMYSIFYGYP